MWGLPLLQILQRSAEMQPGAIKSMDLKGNAYHMTVSGGCTA